jgi:YesN/AraC family two-component response regulator
MQKLLYYEQKTGHLLAECIADSMRFYQTGSTQPEQEASNRILWYIHEHFRERMTNDTIAAEFGYHPNYVSYMVKRATGMPVHRYVLHVRLMNAANLLENTAVSIGEIAAACGFCDTAYFSGYFKKHFGISPSKYRKS